MGFTPGLIQAPPEFGRPSQSNLIPTTTTPQHLNAMIGSIGRELTSSYFDKDLTKKGKHHNDPLHITVDAKGKRFQWS